MRRDLELPQAVLGSFEIRRHAALAVRRRGGTARRQVALQVVGPLVIRADELLGVAAQLAAELRAAVRAAVLEHIDRAVLLARDHDRRRPDVRTDEIAGLRDLGFQRDVIPGAAVEYSLDLALVDVSSV